MREAERLRVGGERSERLPTRRPDRTPAGNMRTKSGEGQNRARGCAYEEMRAGAAWRGRDPVTFSNPRGGAARSRARPCTATGRKRPERPKI